MKCLAPAAAALATAMLVGCAAPDSDYFGPDEPTWVRVPTAVDEAVYVGVTVLRAAPGDTVELLAVSVDGVVGDVRADGLVSVLAGETQLIGAAAASDLPAEIELDRYGSPAGMRIDWGTGPVGFVVRVAGRSAVYGFGEVVLRYRVNGSDPAIDRFPLRATVCADASRDLAIARCRKVAEDA